MATYGDLKNRCLQELLPNAVSTGTLDTAVSRAVVSAVRFFENEPFWFNEGSFTFVTTSGTEAYSATSTFLAAYDLVLNRGTRRIPLQRKALSWIEEQNVSNRTGTPVYWAPYGGTFRLYPIPDSSMTVSVNALLRVLPDLPGSASGSASSAWTNEAEELIRVHAKADIFRNFLRDKEQAANMDFLELRILDQLRLRSSRNTYSGSFEGSL